MSAADHVQAVARARGQAVRSLPGARRAAHDAIGGHPASETLVQRFFGFLGRALSHAFSAVGGGSSSFLGYSILAAIVALILWLVYRLARGRGTGARAAYQPAAATPGASFDQARAEARRLAASNAREGLRLLYAALLAEVGRRRGWRAVPGRSNWTFVRRLGQATSEGGALAECTRLFESRVYGTRAASEGDVRRVDELADVVLA